MEKNTMTPEMIKALAKKANAYLKRDECKGRPVLWAAGIVYLVAMKSGRIKLNKSRDEIEDSVRAIAQAMREGKEED
jgi:hypothetical protein